MQHLADVHIESWTIDPLHEEDRKPVAADKYAFRRVAELGKKRDRRLHQVFLNCPVSLIAIAEITTKAAHGEVAAAVHRFQFVDVSKLARSDERHSEAIDGGERVSQEWMTETDRWALD